VKSNYKSYVLVLSIILLYTYGIFGTKVYYQDIPCSNIVNAIAGIILMSAVILTGIVLTVIFSKISDAVEKKYGNKHNEENK